jgi:2-polyprenyl-3-methyl-5-hydroxy-6-metoxy-1,4-benzoquinol methylase
VNGVIRCRLCDGDADIAFRTRDRNRGLSEQVFTYWRCRACKTIFLADVPSDLGLYYPDDYYALPSPAELDRVAQNEAPKLALLRPWVRAGTLIEVGAGYGLFARAARNAGFDVTAIEMDERCCGYLTSVVGVRTVQSDTPEEVLANLPASSTVVSWHSLEHLSQPWTVLERAAQTLEVGGVLAIAMPNPDSLQLSVLGARWAHIDAPRHLFLIPLAALEARAGQLGLALAYVTSNDRAGRHWNWFGWEYALRRNPARRPSTPSTKLGAYGLTAALAPLERRHMKGTTYTAIFVKR